jgi:UDP-glucose-4-epimerase GalE
MRKVLVVGGAGYIGSHCASALAANGITPVVYDNLSCGHREAAKFGPFITGDILDQDRLSSVFKDEAPDAVFHLAALALVAESIEKPDLYWQNNVEGTKNLLAAMRSAGVGKVVFSSTCAVYGTPERSPIDETTSCNPINPYGETKLAAEALLKEAGRELGIRSVSLRYFNAAGAFPDKGIGEAHGHETHLIPLVLQNALGLRSGLTVNGRDFPTADGTAIRDYVHVGDLADAHLAALAHLDKGGETLSLNLGTGRGASVLEVIRTAEEVTGKDIAFSFGSRRQGDPAELVADAAKAAEVLGWQARFDLRKMIADAWEWHCDQEFGLG